jgi:hypothetical protein
MAEDGSSGTDSASGGSGTDTGDSGSGSGTDSGNSGSGSGTDGGSSGSDSGTSSGTGDYSQLGWKDVMRYVTGFDPDKPEVDGSAISDPQTIQDAADAFYFTQTVLQRAAENLGRQVEALTGPDGPWQGGAAGALGDAMKTLAKQTQDMADTLSGGNTGDYDVPQQLADNAAHLKGAIDKLNDIDVWYAQQALKEAAAEGKDIVMDDRRVAVSQTPDIPPLLDRDMRAVLNTLADNYRVDTDNVAYSTSPTNPANGSGGPDPTAYGAPGSTGGTGGTGGYEPPVSYPDMGSGADGGASSGASNAAAGYLPPTGTQTVGDGGAASGGDAATSGPGAVPPTGQSGSSADTATPRVLHKASAARVLHKAGDGPGQDTGDDPETYRTLVKGHADPATSDPDDGYRTLRREQVDPLTVDEGPGPAVLTDQKEPAGLPGF